MAISRVFFLSRFPGLTEAPKAETVPMSPMVNREMHKAGSCLPCLCLGKYGQIIGKS